MALGLMALDKWDRADQANAPANAQQAAAHDNFTPQALVTMRDTAARMLLSHTATMAQPAWWPAIWQGFASAWLYSFSIAIIALIIKLTGSGDIFLCCGIFSATTEPHRPTPGLPGLGHTGRLAPRQGAHA